eukprot:XP_014788693.1 PREDICTED: uncharacterized protein LOC106882510 [Octopus bimaculoides]
MTGDGGVASNAIKDTELDFAHAVQVAIETEDAAKVAKETVYGSKTKQVYKVQQNRNKSPQKNHQQSYSTNQEKCYRCEKAHKATDCPFKESKCHFCDKKGHLQATLGISVDAALGLKSIDSQAKREDAEVMYPKTSSEPYVSLQQDCHNMCDEFPGLFKQELGCLKNFELEVKFKSDATPVFHKARPVPFALRDDLAKGYKEGIAKGIWKPVQFNKYGTPVVPIRKAHASSNLKPKIRICGDYSVGINDQLADHRHPMPLPVELMQKLRGGFGYTKVDLADAYNQIKLAPQSQRRLALSTHRGEIMENLTHDLPGVDVFQDDMLISGKDASSHLNNLKCLLTRLSDNGLRYCREKCQFALPSVEYLGHILLAGSVPEEMSVFDHLKNVLSSSQVLIHFDPNKILGLTCDASNVGIGAVLFHGYPDGSERRISNMSKTLTSAQRNYSQI